MNFFFGYLDKFVFRHPKKEKRKKEKKKKDVMPHATWNLVHLLKENTRKMIELVLLPQRKTIRYRKQYITIHSPNQNRYIIRSRSIDPLLISSIFRYCLDVSRCLSRWIYLLSELKSNFYDFS